TTLGHLDGLSGDTVVFYCVAMHDITHCEDDPAGAACVNVHGLEQTILACNSFGWKLVYISTDCVFSNHMVAHPGKVVGEKPKSVYGQTKLAGERLLEEMAQRWLVVRINGLYSKYKCVSKPRDNFVVGMVK